MYCVHCLALLKEKTKDHVFPKSWYTDNTPSWVQRWTVPSCRTCNEKFGKMEQALLVRLGSCIDPKKAEASGITKKVLHSLGVGIKDVSEKEKAYRDALRKEFLSEIQPYSSDSKPFPGFGLHKGFPAKEHVTIPFPLDYLMPVLKKILRGTEYKLGGKRYIRDPYELKIYHLEKEMIDVELLFQRFGYSTSLGPGFQIQRAFAREKDKDIVLYKIITWGTLKTYGSIVLKNQKID